MKSKRVKKRFLIVLIGMFLILLPYNGHTAIPQKINYQGYLTSAAGVPINGTLAIEFKIYDVQTGGTALWSETQTVTVTQGVYNVNLGEVTPIPLTFDIPYYLGIKVGTDPEMTPRIPLTSVGYAFRAKAVDTVGFHTHSGADITSGTVAEAMIHSSIARDSEVTSAISTHTSNASAHHTRYTNTEAVAAILAADGAGSGLDADLLDGQHASSFATSGHTHTGIYAPVTHNHDAANINSGTLSTDRFSAYSDLSAEGYLDNSSDGDILTRIQADGRFVNITGDRMTGDLSVWSGSKAITMRHDGSNAFISNKANFVGNGAVSGGVLFLGGSSGVSLMYGDGGALGANGLSLNSSGRVCIGCTDPSTALDVNGQLRVRDLPYSYNYNYVCYDTNNTISLCGGPPMSPPIPSSLRYKEQIQDLKMGLETVEKLRPMTFKWKDREEYDLGLIAEEVAEIDPLLVNYNVKGEVEGVKYIQLTALLVNAIKELKSENDVLRKRISALEGRITNGGR